MTPELFTQILITLIVAIGGILTARQTAGKSNDDDDDHELVIMHLKEQLQECHNERREEQKFYFKELFEKEKEIEKLNKKTLR